MTSHSLPPGHPQAAVAATLHSLLAAQGRRLRARFVWHGLAMLATLVGAAVLLFFSLDRWLLLPAPIRLFHTAVVLALLVGGAVRFLRYPLSRAFGEVDLAVWFERTFPELHQRLVSAVQLHDLPDGELRNQSRPMIEQLLRDTTTAVQALPLQRLFDPRPTARAFAAGGGLAAVLLAGAVWSPATMQAFLLRHLGLAASYPRETTLRVELPPAGADLQRTDRDGLTEIVLPAGADLHVSVLAEGRVPKEVFLDVRSTRDGKAGDERAIAMAVRPGDRFRHVFRRVSGHFEFHARGGDDTTGDRTVVVRTVFPPQVATITATIRPPAYTGVAALEQRGGAIEALLGSEVEIAVTTTTAVRSATMVFLESGRRLDLTATAPQDDSGVSTTYRKGFAIEASDRYQIELIADNGLRNPNPGTYPVAALQDYAPIGRWLLPDDEGCLLLPSALLCVRLDAHDDFGLQAVEMAIGSGAATAITRSLYQPPAAAAGSPPATAAVPTELLEVSELLAAPASRGAGTGGNDGLVLQVTLRDNKQPTAGATELPRRIVQIVDEPQLAAAIARSFRGLREEISQALDIQTDRRGRLEELLAGTEPSATELAQTLTGLEVGQGRVGSTLDRVHRGLMRAFDLHLWNRLETSQHAPRVVELYRERSRALSEPLAVDPEFYRDVQARRTAGTLGALERCLDPILLMLTMADQAGLGPAPDVARALSEAQVARGPTERRALLERALAGQKQLEQTLQQLLLLLQDWNDYQDLVQDVRALRDRQRDLQDRTQEAKGKK